MKTWLLVALIGSMSFPSCGEREKAIEPANIDGLVGTWKLIEPDAYQVTLVIEPVFQTHEKLPVQVLGLSGESSVNQYNSLLSYKARNQSDITIAPVSGTKRAGSAEAMQFEQTYYANLKAVTRYELTGKNRLRFYYNGGVLVYEK